MNIVILLTGLLAPSFAYASVFLNDPLFQLPKIYHQGDPHFLLPDGGRLSLPDFSKPFYHCGNPIELVILGRSDYEFNDIFGEVKPKPSSKISAFFFQLKKGLPQFVDSILDPLMEPFEILPSIESAWNDLRILYRNFTSTLETDIIQLFEAIRFAADERTYLNHRFVESRRVDPNFSDSLVREGLVQRFVGTLVNAYISANGGIISANPFPTVYLMSLLNDTKILQMLSIELADNISTIAGIYDAFSMFRKLYPLSLSLTFQSIGIPKIVDLGFSSDSDDQKKRQIDPRYKHLYAMALSSRRSYIKFFRALSILGDPQRTGIVAEMERLPNAINIISSTEVKLSEYTLVHTDLCKKVPWVELEEVILSKIISSLLFGHYSLINSCTCTSEGEDISKFVCSLSAFGYKDIVIKRLKEINKAIRSNLLQELISLFEEYSAPIYPF